MNGRQAPVNLKAGWPVVPCNRIALCGNRSMHKHAASLCHCSDSLDAVGREDFAGTHWSVAGHERGDVVAVAHEHIRQPILAEHLRRITDAFVTVSVR